MSELSYEEAMTPAPKEISYDEAMKPPAAPVEPLTMSDPLMGGPRIKQAFDEGIGAEPFGLSQDSFEHFQKWGLYRKDDKIDGVKSVLQAFAENVTYPVFAALDAAWRTPGGVYRAGQQAAQEWGAPRDVASIPDAFMGSPHPMGVPKIAGELPKGEPRALTPPDIVAARDLEIIGPPKPEPTFKDSPSEMADSALPRNLSSAASPEDTPRPLGHKPGEYDQRGKEWIDKIDEPDDVRDVIEKIASDHDYFPEARGGVASPQARAAVAEAAGVSAADIDAGYFAEHFDTDGKVRAVIQAVRQTAKDVVDAADAAVKNPSVETAAALAEAQMRHTHVLEYTMGLRAESGRSLAAWKDLLRETERTKARVALKTGEQPSPDGKPGEVPRGTSDLVDAVNEVQENLKTPGKKLGLQKLIDAAEALVGKENEASAGRAAPLSPEIAGLVGEARNVLKRFGKDAETGLSKLVDAAEKQAINMVEQKAVKNPVEALPPELQALVDKTQRVVSRFGGVAHGEKAALLLARTGRTVAEQEQLARSVSGLTPNQVAKVLEKLRDSPEAKRPGWFYWLWQQGLISGLITHSGYAIVNAATVFTERVLAPFGAAVIGKVRGQNVSLTGPLYANVAFVQALPDAFAAASEAFRTGNRVPLASEMRLFERGEESPQASGGGAAYVQGPSPNWGIWKRVFNEDQLETAARALGIPGRAANLMHTFYKVLSERAANSNIAYETAFQEGAKGDKFWQRYQYHLDNPTDGALRQSVNDAYSGAFMSKLGGETEAWAHTLKSNPITKWIFPFQHIPWNIERMSFEYTPLAVLGPEMRNAILGKKGAPAQNLAIAKMAIGSSLIGYFVQKALTGDATGDYPTDPKERQDWESLGIQPNSIKIGGYWVSLERLGPAGNVAHMGASIGSIVKHYDGKDDDAITAAIWAASVAAANQIGNEVGFQSLKNIFEAQRDEKKGAKFVALQAGSFIYPSSFLGQNASIIDPYERKANDLISGLKYRIPFLRETLLPKLDPVYGEPIHNPGYHAIKRMGPVSTDPIKLEMQRLQIHPTQPEDRLGGVKLTPEVYERYQMVAGALSKSLLGTVVNDPSYQQMPDIARETAIRNAIETARKAAGTAIQGANQTLILQGLQQKLDHINGVTHTARPKKAPELAPAAP